MESVKRARKIMKALLIFPICALLFALVAHFTIERDSSFVILLSVWTTFSFVWFSTAEGTIKTLEQEINLLRAGESADTSDPVPPAGEPATDE
jgi:hypothetical protein